MAPSVRWKRVWHSIPSAHWIFGSHVYLTPGLAATSPLRFLVYGEYSRVPGRNTLEQPPYDLITPESALPLPYDGRDTQILLDRQYAPLGGYFSSFYPGAVMDSPQLRAGAPLYFRVRLPASQLAERQGLIQSISMKDGSLRRSVSPQVSLPADLTNIQSVKWEGILRLAEGGEYELRGSGALDISLDGQTWLGRGFLGQGVYRLEVNWSAAAGTSDTRLIWTPPGQDLAEVPAEVLFQSDQPPQGLLASYFTNVEWSGQPAFQQIVPFLMLGWPDQPVESATGFSARFSGTLRIAEPGVYLFRVEADDGARLILDGRVLGEGLTPYRANAFESEASLQPGDHPLAVEYVQYGGGNGLRLLWRHGDGPFEPVPPSALIPAEP